MNTPKLRFKEFKGDWLNLKYRDVLTIKYGKDHKDLKDGSIPVYGTGGVIRYVDSYLYEGESILIGRKGTIDKPKYVNEKFWTVDTLFYTQINSRAFPKFIYQHALQVNWLGLNEATGVPSLNTTSINNIEIYLPCSDEQTKIATFLSSVDDKIAQLSQKSDLLSQYKQGMMQKLFSQQIRFKADDGSAFGEWHQSELKEVAQINPKVKKLPENFIYIDLESVEKGLLLLEKNITLSEAPSRAQRLLSKGDVLFQMVRPYQQNNYYFNLDGQYVASTGYAQIRTELNSKFIYYALHEKSFLDEVMNRCTGTSYPAINSSDLSTIEIGIPCLEEQTKIANFLSAIDQKIEVVAQHIEEAKMWKKGLLQQMFV